MRCHRYLFFTAVFFISFINSSNAQGLFQVNASISPTSVKPGRESLFTYTLQVLGGSPTFWRIQIPWSDKKIVIKSVEKNGGPIWLINQTTVSPRNSVVSWVFHDSTGTLELRTFQNDFGPADILKIIFSGNSPDSTFTASFDSWIRDAGLDAPLIKCIYQENDIKVFVSP